MCEFDVLFVYVIFHTNRFDFFICRNRITNFQADNDITVWIIKVMILLKKKKNTFFDKILRNFKTKF